jgi:hypothetical protein
MRGPKPARGGSGARALRSWTLTPALVAKTTRLLGAQLRARRRNDRSSSARTRSGNRREANTVTGCTWFRRT